MEQSTFQPGDICLECQQHGFCRRLRTFCIDINEQIIKCESWECIYPYENDFSDSDEEPKTSEDKSFCTELNSCSGYDDAASVRFVDALLCCGNSNLVGKSDVLKEAAKTSTQAEPVITLTSFDNSLENLLIKSETITPSFYTTRKNDQTEGAGFIDALLSNCKSETFPNHSINEFQNESTTPLHDMPVLNFDFSNTQPEKEPPPLPKVEKGNKPQIEIQCIQTVKAGFSNIQNEDNVTNTSKVAINSLELIKTEYVQPLQPNQLATQTICETKKSSTANSENKVRISRYFDALRINREKFQKTRTKPTSLERRKRQQKLDIGSGRSLVNVLQVLKTRSE
ncbi:uncharacterized protein LOC101449070 isoform X1 [Ceratitis capitata]|uniref:uncharacterized protein LOC101449070 isoform X1 n=1 Tax=Ceratitis capitata TaxID=7213 RepID=UPI000329A8B0|nr:uncharacterized protein LOC101449070 isoform X1 [Ceratitis capitata]XP_020717096.1 uncharacterized protein LOC101449070 isoform X1 [Ceratitis capitata]